MTDLLSLAERVERAEGADRNLDAMIHHAVKYGVGVGYAADAPAFTASLDAALMLVPEGWTVAHVSEDDGKCWWAELRRGFATSYGKVIIAPSWPEHHSPPLRGCKSPALALTAAALRARAAQVSRD